MDKEEIELQLRRGTWWGSLTEGSISDRYRIIGHLQVVSSPEGMMLIDSTGMIMSPTDVKKFTKNLKARKSTDKKTLEENLRTLEAS